MIEVKRISPDAPQSKGELAALWADYQEDFNTCSLPDKFYDLAAWEARARATRGGAGGAGGSARPAGSMDMLAEHADRQRRAREEARASEAALTEMYRAKMDPVRRSEVASRQEAEQRMAYAFKSGQVAEAERIRKQLADADKRAAEGRG